MNTAVASRSQGDHPSGKGWSRRTVPRSFKAAAIRVVRPARPGLSVRVGRGHRFAVVIMQGDLDIATAPAVAGVFDQLDGGYGLRKVLIDLTAVSFIDLCGLRALKSAYCRLLDWNVNVIVRPSPALLRLEDTLAGRRLTRSQPSLEPA